MAEERTYKKRKLLIETPESPPTAMAATAEEPGLHIDGRYQLTMQEPGTGRYMSHKLPYTAYGSLGDLGEALIDNDLVD